MESIERPQGYRRTMDLNYHGALALTLALLPSLLESGRGQIINISTLGLMASTPRFAAYLASKAAFDAFSRTLAAETRDSGLRVTTVHMPLVRTPMIEPSGIYDSAPALTPGQAADMICEALRTEPARVVPLAGGLLEFAWLAAPRGLEQAMNLVYRGTQQAARPVPLPKRLRRALRIQL